MTKYIKQEMVDLSGKGEEKVYYRIQTQRNIGFKELTEYIERHNNLMNRGLVKNIVDHVVDAMAELIGDGYSVTILTDWAHSKLRWDWRKTRKWILLIVMKPSEMLEASV